MNPKNSINNLITAVVAFVAILLSQWSAHATLYTWTGGAGTGSWTNTANWTPTGSPGAYVLGGGTQNGDVAIFNTALGAGGLGGAGNPIMVETFGTSGVGNGVTNRELGGFTFDTANCGAYVIGDGTGGVSLTAVYNGTFQGSNITVTASVQNPITFSNWVNFRYTSSQNGSFQLTNNAALSSAALTIRLITNSSANSRAFTFTLAGSNTGANTIGHFDDNGGANGSVHLIKSGTGRWVFPLANDFPQKTSAGDSIPANIWIRDGTLEVQDPGSLGAITLGNLIITNTGILQVDNVALNNNGFSVRDGGTIKGSGNATVNYVTMINAPASSGNLATVSSSDVLNVLLVTNGAADTVVHVSGPGKVNLFGAPLSGNGFVGKWSVDSGTLQISNAAALGTSTAISIEAGGTVDSSLITVGTNFPLISLTAKGTGTTVGSTAATIKADTTGTNSLGAAQVNLVYTPTSFSGDSTHPSLYVAQGTLSLGGNTFIISNAAATPLGAGTYTLVQQATGNIASGGGYAATITGSGLATGCVGAIQVTGGNINLIVSVYVPQTLTWTGGNPNSTWDINSTANWLNGGSHGVFNNSDVVLFNSVGSTNPTVTLSGTLAPGSLTVDTSGNNYTFTGSGSLSGAAGLVKMSAGTLTLGTVNTYLGSTVVSNGTLQVAANNAIPSSGDTFLSNTATLDMNSFSNAVGALVGGGTVNNSAAGTSQLSVGANNNSGVFSGLIENTSGALALVKAGNGTETLTAANAFSGGATINAGTIKAMDPNALGAGGLTLVAGVLDLATNVNVAALNGSGGNVENDSTTTTNALIINGSGTNNCVIANGSGGGGVKVLITAGTVKYNNANTYSGGTILASGTTLQFGSSGRAGSGGILASNGVTITISATSPSAAIGSSVTTVDGATVTFSSANTANSFSGSFFGNASATNIYTGNGSLSAQSMFGNFSGTVIFTNSGTRLLLGNNGVGGGTNATFYLYNPGGFNCRDQNNTIYLGALFGGGSIFGPGGGAGTATYVIGGKNIDSTFEGSIFNGLPSTNAAIFKVGTGTLTLSAVTNLYTYVDDTLATIVIGIYTNQMRYTGPTVVSNGVLAFNAPNAPELSSTITLASSTAVLDASAMGYVIYQTNDFGISGFVITNSLVITNSTIEITTNILGGVGTIRGNLLADSTSILNIGKPTGSLTVTTNAHLAGLVNMTVNNSLTPNASELVANSFTIDGTATLTVTNAGPALAGGNVFQLFNHPVNFTGGVTLQNMSGGGILVSNKLAVDGSIVVIATVNTTPTNILFGVTNGPGGPVLSLSWPADHTGWRLQYQTNTLAAGLDPSTNGWFDVPNSANIDATNFLVNPNSPAVFYKMVYP